jgi:hypothetical protein
MFDGWFTKKNFFEPNTLKGGRNFTQALFNPQLDLYTFSKHYHDEEIPVLTFPPELHRYHNDGFPSILAFRDGSQIVRLPEGSLFPYDSAFRRLRRILWNDNSVRMEPVSDLQFATRIIYENMAGTALIVVPDGDTAGYRRSSEFAVDFKCGTVKYFSQIASGDMTKSILFDGKFSREIYPLLTQGKTPFKLDGDSVLCFGPYRFGIDTIGISACFPNPADPEKVIVMKVRGIKTGKGFFDNSVDYTIYCSKETGSPRTLVHGFFGKDEENRWAFADSLCVSHIQMSKECVGVCTIPEKRHYPEHDVLIKEPRVRQISVGREYEFGRGSCRFPSIASDGKGRVMAVWEEWGDILLTDLAGVRNPLQLPVENDASDSYRPVVVFSGGTPWIFYLNNRDGFYRLYARSLVGNLLSEPVLISAKQPCDVVTPAIIASGNTITAVWSCWKANLRYPFYRTITSGIADSIHPQNTVMSDAVPGYVNAWFPSLAADTTGIIWGAWNQHYPATLGVCSGNIGGVPVSVTRASEEIEACENGGYPTAVTDEQNQRWVFWESDAWDVADGGRQKIMGSVYNRVSGSWSTPVSLPEDPETFLNQTPQAAFLADGRICVVWSGRARSGDWKLYLVYLDNDIWTRPVILTSGKEPARAPAVTATGNTVWVACHYGKGEGMKVRVIRITGDE